MSLEEFIIWVYCWVDENTAEILGEGKLRRRGCKPALSDTEVITMDIVGEFLSLDTNKSIWSYFKIHWGGCFPRLGSSSNFARQANYLWHIKQLLQEKLTAKQTTRQLNKQQIVDAILWTGFQCQRLILNAHNKVKTLRERLVMAFVPASLKLTMALKDICLSISKET